jgi:hypothetical protein
MSNLGCTGIQGFCMRDMEQDLISYQAPIRNWLRTKYSHVYTPELAFDCWSNGNLDVLTKGYTMLNPQGVKDTMFQGAYSIIKSEYSAIQSFNAVRKDSEGSYVVRQYLDFNKLDPRYVNSLTPLRREIWKRRCAGMSTMQIATELKRSQNNVCVNMLLMRKSYVKWIRECSWLKVEHIKYLPTMKYLRPAMRLKYLKGYGISSISRQLGIHPNYTRQILLRGREALRNKGLVPMC